MEDWRLFSDEITGISPALIMMVTTKNGRGAMGE